MSVTYSLFAEKVYRQLSDPDAENYSDDLVYDAICAAHDAVLTWVPNYQEVTLTAGSDPGLFELPSDIYDIQAVQILDESRKFISQATLAAGTTRGNTSAENDWTESPKGWLSLSTDLDEGDNIKIYYLAHWEIPTNSSDNAFVIRVPRYAHQGMIYYAISIILEPTIIDTATLGPFKGKVDSGTPIHNPMKDVSNWFRSLFIQEMKLMPPYQKAFA